MHWFVLVVILLAVVAVVSVGMALAYWNCDLILHITMPKSHVDTLIWQILQKSTTLFPRNIPQEYSP